MRVKLTKTQREEIFEKLDIVSSEDCLLSDYEVTIEEVEALKLLFHDSSLASMYVTIDNKYIDLLVEELENVCDICDDNIDCGDDESRAAWSAYKRSMKNAIKKLRS